ncbi:MAG: ribonuclease J [Hyphomicrobiaceae bacterium]
MANNDVKSGSAGGQDELVFVALGGLGEIGMNVYLYGFGPETHRQWLMVDLGITFPGESEPGVDVVLPDLKFLYENPKSLIGIVLTHAHEDHIGAVVDLWPKLKAPVYATPFTAGMVQSKTQEFGNRLKLPIKQVPLGGRVQIGPFDIEFVTMSHSVPESSALAIRTPLGTVLHTGDWKLDKRPFIGQPADEKRLQELGEEGVLAMVCDSTNAFREGRSPSEEEVARSIMEIIKQQKRRVAITTFSSNVARVKAVADAAEATGRQLVVAGRSLHRVIDVAIDTGYLPKNFKYLDQDQAQYLNARDTCILCTGSQGEARAAISRISQNEHPAISLGKGDTVIFSSRTIPGNERPVGKIQNNLAHLGVDVITDNEALVHVTGHPRRDELKQMYAWIKPKVAIPMHGEARHLKEQGRLARAAGVATVVEPLNGDVVLIAPGQPRIVDEIHTGRLFRDGRLIVPDSDGPVRERRKLMQVGMAMVAITLTPRGDILGYPQVALDGVPQDTDRGEAMYDVALDAVEGTLKSIPQPRRKDPEMVREAVRRAVRGAIAEAWGKKPIVKVLINVVEK